MRLRVLPCLLIAITVLVSPPRANADAPEGRLLIFGVLVEPLSDYSGTIEGIPTTVTADSVFGFGIAAEYLLSRNVGIETEWFMAEVDFDVEAMGVAVELGSSWMSPFLVALNYHFNTGEGVDLYAGPLVAYTLWGNLEGSFGSSESESDFGFGAQVGVDIPARSGWALAVGVKYFTVSAGDESIEIDVDPLVLRLGVSYRF